ncbi:SRPBCC family protein [Nocardia concava]|uniref:SRPBCC family protein n=1 Tax=Nocardia concava TaxID=257281 RepID=UPI0002EFB218|nr:SRPBCC family protein [Nocardia concava]
MKFMVGYALAIACATMGSPAAGSTVARAESPISRAEAGPACVEFENDYKLEWQASWAVYQAEQQNLADARAVTEVDLPITIDAPIDKVWSVYTDVRNGIGRHSFLKDVIVHRLCEADGVRVTDFTALEDIPMGSATFPGHTQAETRLHPDQYFYETDSWDVPNVTTHQLITFADNGDGTTTVNEHLTFIADQPLIDFTVTNGVAAHRASQAAVKEDIENGTL